jgi:hypothetical protein
MSYSPTQALTRNSRKRESPGGTPLHADKRVRGLRKDAALESLPSVSPVSHKSASASPVSHKKTSLAKQRTGKSPKSTASLRSRGDDTSASECAYQSDASSVAGRRRLSAEDEQEHKSARKKLAAAEAAMDSPDKIATMAKEGLRVLEKLLATMSQPQFSKWCDANMPSNKQMDELFSLCAFLTWDIITRAGQQSTTQVDENALHEFRMTCLQLQEGTGEFGEESFLNFAKDVLPWLLECKGRRYLASFLLSSAVITPKTEIREISPVTFVRKVKLEVSSARSVHRILYENGLFDPTKRTGKISKDFADGFLANANRLECFHDPMFAASFSALSATSDADAETEHDLGARGYRAMVEARDKKIAELKPSTTRARKTGTARDVFEMELYQLSKLSTFKSINVEGMRDPVKYLIGYMYMTDFGREIYGAKINTSIFDADEKDLDKNKVPRSESRRGRKAKKDAQSETTSSSAAEGRDSQAMEKLMADMQRDRDEKKKRDAQRAQVVDAREAIKLALAASNQVRAASSRELALLKMQFEFAANEEEKTKIHNKIREAIEKSLLFEQNQREEGLRVVERTDVLSSVATPSFVEIGTEASEMDGFDSQSVVTDATPAPSAKSADANTPRFRSSAETATLKGAWKTADVLYVTSNRAKEEAHSAKVDAECKCVDLRLARAKAPSDKSLTKSLEQAEKAAKVAGLESNRAEQAGAEAKKQADAKKKAWEDALTLEMNKWKAGQSQQSGRN